MRSDDPAENSLQLSVLPHRNRHWEEARQQSGSTAELKLSLINKTRLSVLLYYNYTLYYGTGN